jgi:hypothetical protein
MRAVGRRRLRPPCSCGQDAGGEGAGAGACDGRRQCSAAGSVCCRRFSLDPGSADGTDPGTRIAALKRSWVYHHIIPVSTAGEADCGSGIGSWVCLHLAPLAADGERCSPACRQSSVWRPPASEAWPKSHAGLTAARTAQDWSRNVHSLDGLCATMAPSAVAAARCCC